MTNVSFWTTASDARSPLAKDAHHREADVRVGPHEPLQVLVLQNADVGRLGASAYASLIRYAVSAISPNIVPDSTTASVNSHPSGVTLYILTLPLLSMKSASLRSPGA